MRRVEMLSCARNKARRERDLPHAYDQGSSRADLTSLTPASHVMISKYHLDAITRSTATARGRH